MEVSKVYEDIALRTEGDIYVGVVGPVRTGKSTFIKRFMETLVIPNIENVYRKERARDELPQSGSGRTIMTAEPKFVPEEAAEITMDSGAVVRVRLIDSVGYMIPDAVGQMEDDVPRMVMTPWFDHEIPMVEAAEVGTRKVIADHSTIGIVITTDGTVTDIPRESYQDAEERVIDELKQLGKPFVILVNSRYPNSDQAKSICRQLEARYDVSCEAVNCLEMEQDEISKVIQKVLFEFPINRVELTLPAWVNALGEDHPIKTEIYQAIRSGANSLHRVRDVRSCIQSIADNDKVSRAEIRTIELGTGIAKAALELPRELFYQTVSQQSGFSIRDDGDMLSLLTELAQIKNKYDQVAQALEEVEKTGYGIVVPSLDSLVLEEPEIVRQGGRYGVKLKASAPSIHMIRADIETEVSPIVGTEKQSEEMIHYLLEQFEGDTKKIWQSNMFGRSFHELVGEDLNTKLKRMPDEARSKLRETLQRIINEGSGGLICIIL